MKKFFVMMMILGWFDLAHAVKAQYPMVGVINGHATWKFRNHVDAVTRLQVLEGDGVFSVDEKSQLRVEIDEHTSLVALAGTDFAIQFNADKSTELERVILERGQIRFIRDAMSGGSVELRSPIANSNVRMGDYLMNYDEKNAFCEMIVFKGVADFSGLQNENSAQVQSGQRISFRGVVEDGAPAFDILLHNQKVARGQLNPALTLSAKELAQFDSVSTVQKTKLEVILAKPKRKPGEICENPVGKFNQCAWVCSGSSAGDKKCHVERKSVHCMRMKCNANGQWADKETLTGELAHMCEVRPRVGKCNY